MIGHPGDYSNSKRLKWSLFLKNYARVNVASYPAIAINASVNAPPFSPLAIRHAALRRIIGNVGPVYHIIFNFKTKYGTVMHCFFPLHAAMKTNFLMFISNDVFRWPVIPEQNLPDIFLQIVIASCLLLIQGSHLPGEPRLKDKNTRSVFLPSFGIKGPISLIHFLALYMMCFCI